MSSVFSSEEYKKYLRELRSCINRRVEAEQQIAMDYGFGDDSAEKTFRELEKKLMDEFEQTRGSLQDEFETVRSQMASLLDTEYGQMQAEYTRALNDIQSHYSTETAATEQQADDNRWMMTSVLDDTADDSPKRQFEALKTQLLKAREQQLAEWESLEAEYEQITLLLKKQRQWRDTPRPKQPELPGELENARKQFEKSVEASHENARKIRRQVLPRLFASWVPLFAFLLLTGGICLAVWGAVDPSWIGLRVGTQSAVWMSSVTGAAAVVSAILFFILYSLASRKIIRTFTPLERHFAEAKFYHHHWLKLAKQELEQRQKEYQKTYSQVVLHREHALKTFEENRDQRLKDLAEEKDRRLRQANSQYPPLLQQLADQRNEQLRLAEKEFQRRLDEATQQFDVNRSRLMRQQSQFVIERQQNQDRDWNQLADKWLAGTAAFRTHCDELNGQSADQFPDWPTLAEASRRPPTEIPAGVRIGQYNVSLEQMANGLPGDKRLTPKQVNFSLPAVLPFPEKPSLLLKADGAGRAAAIGTLQVAMLRLLTLLPPGKLRFTIIDPVGLGDNFSGFMHLGDYDELLISSRIWTESSHIEQRLADLTEHMENVFQKYLRNEFQSIEEYNHHAGEVAEPYHVLVIAGFPTNFNENSARRLSSIATNGSRCGVYTLISVDAKQQLPFNFDLADLEQNATNFVWKDGRFVSTDPEFGELNLSLDAPPPPELFSEIVKKAGFESKDVRRVEVAFARIAPRDDTLWSCDSRSGIDIPLGRAGAMKLQHMRLGKGTSQHVMIAGKTGSGKSTFLHALVTNLSLHYSPHEIEFYLIDFKKGVEFKTYATHELPHARVIAVESDREFGVSALERLDGILKERGELFRQRGVQDLEGFRNANPDIHMPRILLVIDEFQEFFVEDDRLSQAASLLLDRLVRQGRAFGIHVLLGSQTLAGAYSLARSTLGQVAVRVALQCSEADAHLILSEENTAARLLTRPGEAIYNDANGLLEGNNPFQIAWLDDEDREAYLKRIRQLAVERGITVEPAIIFEGNVLSDPKRNVLLTRMIESPADERTAKQTAPTIWLGEAVSIQDPCSIQFARRAGSNLLVVGQSGESAMGLLSTGLLTLAAQQNPETDSQPASFFVFDGSDEGSRESQLWRHLADAVPHHIEIIGPGMVDEALEKIAAIVNDRGESNGSPASPVFLVVFHLGRFRQLRKADDDFGFGGFDKKTEAGPAERFGNILRDGPELGVHSVVWCDTYNNVERWFARQLLREFEMRIVFQMSTADSSNLIDSPEAGRLGTNRALVYLEEQGSIEKFRPYDSPSAEWLQWVSANLSADVLSAGNTSNDDLSMWEIQ